MCDKIIKNVSKGIFKKLFGKERIEGVGLSKTGFVIIMEKGEKIPVAFENIKAVKANFYLDKMTPYRTVTIVTIDEKEYILNTSSDREEANYLLKHYAGFQTGGGIPDNLDEIKVTLQYGLNDYRIRLENGKLIETKRGEEHAYALDTIEYYRIDKPSNSINIKFKDKKLFVTLSAIHVTNVWLVLEILNRIAKKQAWPV